MKQLGTQELQKILSIVQAELRHRQDTSFSPAQEMSSILQILFKDGTLRTYIPKLSTFIVGKGLKEKSPLSSGVMNSKLSEDL